ncbi:MAG: hypothetical protein ACKO3O_01805 [Gammaproteobacteria bacterium]
MNTQLSAIVEVCREAGLALEGAVPEHCSVTGIAAVQDCGPGDLVFADKPALLNYVLERHPRVVVAARGLREKLAAVGPATVVLLTGQVSLAHAFIKQRYAARDFAAAGWEGPVHPSAVVHPSATIGTDTFIEPRAVVGRNAVIGARCRIMSGAVVENDAIIGDDSIVHPNAVIGYGCRLGKEVVVGAGSVIGAEGFGFAQDANRRSHPIPQTGIVSSAIGCVSVPTIRSTAPPTQRPASAAVPSSIIFVMWHTTSRSAKTACSRPCSASRVRAGSAIG